MLRRLENVIDVACPKCEVSSGTRCVYTYTEPVSRYRKAWRINRAGETMFAFHNERHAVYRDLRDNWEVRRRQLRMWLLLHADIFRE